MFAVFILNFPGIELLCTVRENWSFALFRTYQKLSTNSEECHLRQPNLIISKLSSRSALVDVASIVVLPEVLTSDYFIMPQ